MIKPRGSRDYGPRKGVNRLFSPVRVRYEPLAIDEPDPRDYRESPEFAAYCELVASVLSLTEPLNTRAIHERLGPKRIIRAWTLDALDRVAIRRPAFIDTFLRKPELTRF